LFQLEALRFRHLKNTEALANPEALEVYREITELRQ
jgi:hypothetical protein